LAFALLLRLSRSKGYILFLIIHQLENEEKILKVTKKQQKQTIFIQIKYSNIKFISAASHNSLLKLTQDGQGAIGRDFMYQNQVHAHLQQPHRTIFSYLQSN
jgi:hypothetical protein